MSGRRPGQATDPQASMTPHQDFPELSRLPAVLRAHYVEATVDASRRQGAPFVPKGGLWGGVGRQGRP